MRNFTKTRPSGARAAKAVLFAASAAMLMASSASAQVLKESLEEWEGFAEQAFDTPVGVPGPGGVVSSAPAVSLSFEGISQYDVAAFGRNFIPPDTMGAVGRSQFMEFTNGAVAVYDKATGARTSLVSDVAWWATAGQVGANGDQRVLFDAAANRWVALGFGASASDIQIAVSDTSDALGGWKSTKFTGYSGVGFGGAVADYPTLAIDTNAIYIGTNNFARTSPTSAQTFQGTTLNVIPLSSIYAGGGPSVAGNVQFTTPYPGTFEDRGYAIQGVNSREASTTGNVMAVSLFNFALERYDVTNAGTSSAARTPVTFVGSTYDFDYDPAAFARQPDGTRNIDPLDDRISANVWEVDGRIYSVHTVQDPGDDHKTIRWTVVDSLTNAVLDEGEIGGGGFDYYQASLAVNEFGKVVIGYNRSGFGDDGKISIFAQMFGTNSDGTLYQRGSAILLKESIADDYHNGSTEGQPAAGRQRWGDYSAVTVDPDNPNSFWVIGEFAREWNNPASGHPGGTGGSRWGTWIAALDATAVPEPATWAMMLVGFGMMGWVVRRRTVKFGRPA
jgi:hypothetical protein